MPTDKKKIIFIIEASKLFREDDDSGRYPFLILNGFSEVGYSIFVLKKMNFKKYIGLCKYGREIYSIKNLKFITKLPSDPSDYILVFDQEALHPEIISADWKKSVYLNAYKPKDWILGAKWIWIPYFMHIFQYKRKHHTKLEGYRSNRKKIRIFFAGNTHKDYYSNPNLGMHYGQMTRSEGLKALMGLTSDTQIISGAKELDRLNDDTAPLLNKCMVFETNCFTIDPDRWLDILSRMDFFVCLSGTDLPMCHNAIESMAVGVIPIISYQDWFFPALEHHKNAIIYTDAEDLKKKIKEVLFMDESTIARLRQNVIDYYEDHLSANSFARSFEERKDKVMTLVLHPRYVCDERDEKANSKDHFIRLKDQYEPDVVPEATLAF